MAMFEPRKVKGYNDKLYNGFYCTGCKTDIFQSQRDEHRRTCHKDIPVRKTKGRAYCKQCLKWASHEHVFNHNG